jgi:tripartite-type tricarboxylate transporter receptor subunit TctC
VKFNLSAGIEAVDVPPQPTDAIADIVAGTIEGRTTYLIAPISIVLPHIRDGNLFPLGVTTVRRSTLLPQVPTIAEAGAAGFDFPIWYGIWVPAGTPAGVVDKLSKDIGRVLAGPVLRDWVTKHGGEPMSMTQPEFARFVQAESESAARLIKAVEIKPRTNP